MHELIVYKRHLKIGVFFYSRIEDSKIPKKRYYGGPYDALSDLFFTIDRFLELVFYQNSGPEYHQIFIIYRKNHPTQSKAVQCLYNKEIQLQRAFILTLIASKSSE